MIPSLVGIVVMVVGLVMMYIGVHGNDKVLPVYDLSQVNTNPDALPSGALPKH